MERRWISIREASEYLSLHEITVRRLVDRGEIPASRIGHSVRVDLRRLQDFLERQEQEIAPVQRQPRR